MLCFTLITPTLTLTSVFSVFFCFNLSCFFMGISQMTKAKLVGAFIFISKLGNRTCRHVVCSCRQDCGWIQAEMCGGKWSFW